LAFEFRSKDENPRWRSFWDWAIFGGSLVPALLWGVAFANFVKGVPIDASTNYTGGFFNLLNWYALLGGLVSLLGFILHGAIFLSLKTADDLAENARRLAFRLWIPVVAVLVLFTVATYLTTDILQKLGVNPGPVPIGAMVTILLTGYFIFRRWNGWAFVMTTLTIVFATMTMFMTLYPRVLVSSTSPDLSLTIYNTASGPTTLNLMTIVALIFVPIVLAYQAWTYWVFRKRVTAKPESLTY
jgi:cytochrome d ubiquinol oxidase subunit II